MAIGDVAVVSFVILNAALTGCSLWLQLQPAWAAHFSGVKSLRIRLTGRTRVRLEIIPQELGCRGANYILGVEILCGPSPITVIADIPSGVADADVDDRLDPQTVVGQLLSPQRRSAVLVCGHSPRCGLGVGRSQQGQNCHNLHISVGGGHRMGMRSYLQIASMRQSPRLFNSLILTEINRYKPFTKYLFTIEGVYSFHAGLPLPPQLADISPKRLWSGDMTNAKMATELAKVKPGVILIANQTGELLYQELLQDEYRLVYQDSEHQLYALKSIIPLADP